MKVFAALFVAAVFVACTVGLANGKPQKQDSESGASVQVGDYVLSIAPAAKAAVCNGNVLNTVCSGNNAANDACINVALGGVYCSGTCVNSKPCCVLCPRG